MKLYILASCPFCIRVLNFLNSNKVEGLQIVSVPPPHSMRTELKEASGQTFVPTLVDGNTIIADDDEAIIKYLAEKVSQQVV